MRPITPLFGAFVDGVDLSKQEFSRDFIAQVKADMVGHYLGEFSITYKPVRHGRPGIGATSSSKFIPLK